MGLHHGWHVLIIHGAHYDRYFKERCQRLYEGVKMKRISWLILFLAITWCFTAGNIYAEGLRIGVVDVQKVIRECVAGKDATRRLKLKQDERASDMGARKSEITALKKSIEELDPVLEKDIRDKKKTELASKTQAMKDAESKFSRQMREINSSQSSSVKSEVFRVIDQVAKRNGLSVVFDKGQVMYSGGASDITSQVIEEYDSEFQRTR